MTFCWVDVVGEVTGSYGHGCLSVWNGFCQIHLLHEVFFVAEVLLEKIPDNKNTPPPPSCPRDPLRHELKVHIINARAELQDTQQKKYTVVSFFPRTMDENENRIKYAVSSCYHDHGFNEERFNFEDLEWRSESPNMLINVATKNIGQTTTKNNTELNISEMSRWVYDFLFGAWKIWKRFMHLEPLLILIYRPW